MYSVCPAFCVIENVQLGPGEQIIVIKEGFVYDTGSRTKLCLLAKLKMNQSLKIHLSVL